MIRSKSLTTGAILQALLSIVDIMLTLPILAAGSAGLPAQPGNESMGGPPFFIGVFFIIAAVSGLFAAYGLWVNQKWGKVLTIIIRVIMGLFALLDLYAAPDLLRLMFGLYVLASIVVIFLVLRVVPRTGQRVTTSPPAA